MEVVIVDCAQGAPCSDYCEKAVLDSEYLEKWGFDLETVYKFAVKFYKGW